MDLGLIYNMLHNAVNYQHFMILNQLIIENSEINDLTNSRKKDRMNTNKNVLAVKNKLVQFINKATK